MKASQFSEAQKAFILKQGRDGMPVAEFGASDVAIEAEGELVGIEALGTAAELRPLKLFDDRLKSVDLAVTISTTAAMLRRSPCSKAMSDGRLSR